jgi:hypothetical protein
VQVTRAAYRRSFWGNLQQHVDDATRWWAGPGGGEAHQQGFHSSPGTKGFVVGAEEDGELYGPPQDWMLQGQ